MTQRPPDRNRPPPPDAGADGSSPAPREGDPGPSVPADLERLASLLDDAFTLPGTRYRIGLDGILGLVPGVGDLLTAVPALFIIKRSLDLGVPRVVAARMLGNVLLENLVGTVPLVGDLFDFAWKANRRNLRLLAAHRSAPDSVRRRSGFLMAGVTGFLVLGALTVLAVPLLILIALVRLAFGA